MIITTRKTQSFIELKVDELEETLFKEDDTQLLSIIENLENVVEELKSYLSKL